MTPTGVLYVLLDDSCTIVASDFNILPLAKLQSFTNHVSADE